MCDVLSKAMEDKNTRFKLESVQQYTDYKEMLEKEKPELVAIATESGKHAQIALDCISAGCNVIIESRLRYQLLMQMLLLNWEKKRALWFVPIIKTDSINQFNISAKHLKADDLANCRMEQHMLDGIAGKAIMIKHRGVELGRRMVDV